MKYGLIAEKKIFLIVSAILVIWGANEDDESIDSHDLEVFAQDFFMGKRFIIWKEIICTLHQISETTVSNNHK